MGCWEATRYLKWLPWHLTIVAVFKEWFLWHLTETTTFKGNFLLSAFKISMCPCSRIFRVLKLSIFFEKESSYNFFRANQEKGNINFYSWTQYDFNVNRCDWRILACDEKNINSKGLFESPRISKNVKAIYVLLRLRVQNRRKKWNFPPNFQNSIIWTAPFPLNIHNGIIWGGAFSKAFRSSEALILVLSKNARLYDNI